MPALYEAAYVANYWQDLGFAASGGMSAVPLTALEISAWANGSGVELNAWEFFAIKEMSRAYVSQMHESESMECPPPYGAAWNEFDRGIVGNKITNAFRALIQAKRK